MKKVRKSSKKESCVKKSCVTRLNFPQHWETYQGPDKNRQKSVKVDKKMIKTFASEKSEIKLHILYRYMSGPGKFPRVESN